jgi:DNA polymerase-3 subunit beta
MIGNCLFNVSKNIIEIVSTDNEIAVRTKVESTSDKSLSFAVNGKKFASILKELPNDELSITVTDSLLIDIKSNSKKLTGHYTLVGIQPDEYPEIPRFRDENALEIEQSTLKDMIRRVVYAASSDSIKPVFNGVFFISDEKGKVASVATDSRRLALTRKETQNTISFGEGIIIPLKTVNEIFRLLENTGTCSFSFNESQCFFKIGDTEVISRIVDGQFPNYRQVLPKEYMFEMEIETRRLLDSVKRAMVFTREPANKVILNISGSRIVILASTPELGEAEEEIEVKTNRDEKISLGINAQFLLDALKEIDADFIVCGVTGEMSPVALSPKGDENYISIIMPIQIKSSHSE